MAYISGERPYTSDENAQADEDARQNARTDRPAPLSENPPR